MKEIKFHEPLNIFSSKENYNQVYSVLKIILYFDVFNYPLTLNEIYLFGNASKEKIKEILSNLIQEKKLFKFNSFYTLSDNVNNVKRRIKGNDFAKKIIIKATKRATFISNFPFIEAVYVSGSLSKGYFEKEDDIDYFIITKPNRLWLAKTLLITYKKIFLLNSKRYFCINYFITSNSLELKEKNIFTAIEFVTLLPILENDKLLDRFKKQNTWVKNYFPNYKMQKKAKPIKKYKSKLFFEFLLNGFIGSQLEKLSKNITKSFQQRKYRKLQKADFNIAFKGNDSVSKHHPDNNQKKIITLLNNKIENFNKAFKTTIPKEFSN